MKCKTFNLLITALILFSSGLTGCGKKSEDTDKSGKSASHNDNKHSHPSKGPHKGTLIELGDDEYHAEIVFDEKNETTTIYILDSSAKKPVPIDATEVIINLKHKGKPEQFKLPAVPDQKDPKGKSSRFQLKDGDLIHDIEEHDDAEPKLTVKISGKGYTGEIEHDHEKGDHKH
ncbi:MAG: hypothetical protein Tsb009_05210 [Planctomycetaceae bacterium]